MAPKPDFIVVTGDLSNRGRSWELRDAEVYLKGILNDFWVNAHHVARCIVIPGNHDVWPTTVASIGAVARHDRLQNWNAVFPGWSFLADDVPTGSAADLTPLSLDTYYKQLGLEATVATTRAARVNQMCEFFPVFGVAFPQA